MRGRTRLAVGAVMAIAPIVALAGPAQAATTVALWYREDPSSMIDSTGGNNGTDQDDH